MIAAGVAGNQAALADVAPLEQVFGGPMACRQRGQEPAQKIRLGSRGDNGIANIRCGNGQVVIVHGALLPKRFEVGSGCSKKGYKDILA
jgi:hypothetical protein